MKRSPLKAKRETPRRNEGRIRHDRVKRPRAAAPDPIERQHHARLREMPCLGGCGRRTAHLHHVMHMPAGVKRTRRDHRYVLPLCDGCHQNDRDSIHGCGSEAIWGEARGIDVPAWAIRQWEISNADPA